MGSGVTTASNHQNKIFNFFIITKTLSIKSVTDFHATSRKMGELVPFGSMHYCMYTLGLST